MSNSSLISKTVLSPNYSNGRKYKVTRITPHCTAGNMSIDTIGNVFKPSSRKASCQYGIGDDGRIVLICDESNRSWCSSSADNDNRAITIEASSDNNHPYAVNTNVWDSLVKLCVDICKRYGKKKLLWFDDKNKSLSYNPKSDEMVITVHRWFANKACPGDYMYNRMGELAETVTKHLNNTSIGIVEKVEGNKVIKYNTIEDVPKWGKAAVEWAIKHKILLGDGSTLALNEDNLKSLVYIYRLEQGN